MAPILSTAAFGGANENFEKASRRGESLSEQTEIVRYSDRDGIVKDATQLTESDLRYLLE